LVAVQHHRCNAVNAWDIHDFFVFQARFDRQSAAQGKGSHLTATRVISAALSGGPAGFFVSREMAMAKTKKKSKAKARPKSKAKSAKPKSKGPSLLFAIAQTTLPIVGSDQLFPVRRIYCIGRNYAAHAREMGSDPTREPPFFFQKPTDAVQVVFPGPAVDHPYPSLTSNYHYEVELVTVLKSGGKNIPAAKALDHVYGYAIGLDMTRRDLQIGMREQKKPWSLGKGFDHGAPIGPILPAARIGHPSKGAISLSVNGVERQKSDLSNMTWSVPEQIEKLSEAFELKAGDIIMTGTPENVGPVVPGDVIVCKIAGLPDLSIRIVKR
jgi:2-keto-4-pentenoate hydratase/2-oxohepta-3-ene-1,7-dioic acid hydratase in catechol pathway